MKRAVYTLGVLLLAGLLMAQVGVTIGDVTGITRLPAIDAVAADDEVAISDTSGGDLNRATVTQLGTAIGAGGAVFTDLDTDYGNETITSDFDFGGGTVQVPNSATLPGTCEVGDGYMDSDATSGQRWYLCESADTWALQGDGDTAAVTPMYGHLYGNESPSGQAITIVTQSVHVGLNLLTAGKVVGLTADVADAAGDNLEVPVGGAGDYEIIYHVSIPFVLNKRSEAVILKNGSELTGSVSFAFLSDSGNTAIGAMGTGAVGIFTLAEGDEIAIGVSNETDTTNLNYFTVHLIMKRIGT